MCTHEPRLILVSLLIGWKNGARTLNQSLSEVMQNQSNSLITFVTQLKIALFIQWPINWMSHSSNAVLVAWCPALPNIMIFSLSDVRVSGVQRSWSNAVSFHSVARSGGPYSCHPPSCFPEKGPCFGARRFRSYYNTLQVGSRNCCIALGAVFELGSCRFQSLSNYQLAISLVGLNTISSRFEKSQLFASFMLTMNDELNVKTCCAEVLFDGKGIYLERRGWRSGMISAFQP